jgi:2TM family of unknown function (DUF5676)
MRLTIRGTGLALGLFFAVTFSLCILWGLLLPGLHARGVPVLEGILPGFVWLTPGSIVLGLVEAFLFGFYVALIFVPFFNYFEGGRAATIETPAPSPSVHHEAMAHR